MSDSSLHRKILKLKILGVHYHGALIPVLDPEQPSYTGLNRSYEGGGTRGAGVRQSMVITLNPKHLSPRP